MFGVDVEWGVVGPFMKAGDEHFSILDWDYVILFAVNDKRGHADVIDKVDRGAKDTVQILCHGLCH